MPDFEVCPVGTLARLAEAERLIARAVQEDGLRSSTEADMRAFLRPADSADVVASEPVFAGPLTSARQGCPLCGRFDAHTHTAGPMGMS